MLEFLAPAARQSRAIAQTQVRAVVENGHVGFAEQSGNRAERATETAVEKHGIFAAQKFRDLAFQFSVQIGHAGEDWRTARAHPVGAKGLVRGLQHFRMIRQPQVIIGAKIDDRVRFALVIDGGAGVG